jgi:UDP:flavonoid glycosyltransferase YjiC (YdhE family)
MGSSTRGHIVRVLITTSPGLGHIFPTVSTAWALRAAGHDVILATGGHHDLACRAGLQVVDAAPGVDFGKVFRDFFAENGPPDATAGSADGRAPDGLGFVARLFARVSRQFSDHTVDLVRRWRPDLVVYTPLQGVGQLAAQVAGVPSVAHTIGIAQPSVLWTTLAQQLADEYERFGVTPADPAAILDVSPPSMRAADATGWSMRYVPYNGGAVLPPSVFRPRERPLVTVTLGSVLPLMAGVGALRPFVAAAGAMPADFVITLGGAQRDDFGPLPANVELVDWVPLGALLANSAAVIHHGGAGTTLTALNAGLPQLMLPQGADQFLNATAVAKSGAGAVVAPEDLDADRIAELLADGPMRAAAEGVATEMAAQPTPADLVARIIRLAT